MCRSRTSTFGRCSAAPAAVSATELASPTTVRPRLGLQERSQALPHHGVVVGDHDRERIAHRVQGHADESTSGPDAAANRDPRRTGARGGSPSSVASLCQIAPVASKEVFLDAAGRELRVSSPERVIFPATERTPALTKLDIVEYYLAVGDGIMRALARRPTTLERWPKGVHPDIVALDPGGPAAAATPSSRSACPKGAPDYVRDRADRVPLRPHRRRGLPDRDRGRRLVRADGDDHVPPVAGAATPTSTIPTSCGSTSTRSRARTSPTRCGSRARRASCSASSATPASRRPRAAAASTSTCGSSRAGRSPTSATRRSPSAASSSGGCPGEVTTKWWKEERGERIFVDYNQNARDRTIASAYSIRPKPGAPVSAPLEWDELGERAPEDFTVGDDAGALRRASATCTRRSTTSRTRCSRCSTSTSATAGRGRHALSARLPEDAGRAQARAAVARPRPPAG